MYCSRDHNYSSQFNQQYEKPTQSVININIIVDLPSVNKIKVDLPYVNKNNKNNFSKNSKL